MPPCPLNTSLFLSRLRVIWVVGEALDVGGGASDRPASYQEQMSHQGQIRKRAGRHGTSVLPPTADVVRLLRHVRKVPTQTLAAGASAGIDCGSLPALSEP